MVVVWPLSKQAERRIGDIVIFRSESGELASRGWIFHRIIEGNDAKGYMTKGDNNELSDQSAGETGAIQRDWIVSRAITWQDKPIVIPKLGYLPLYAEQFQQSPWTLPSLALVLAGVVGVMELRGKKRRRRHGVDGGQALYVLTGLTVAVIIGGVTLSVSQQLHINYSVPEAGRASSGPSVGTTGVIPMGERVEKPLSTLNNATAFPLAVSVSSEDKQITFSQNKLWLTKGEKQELVMAVEGRRSGVYHSTIHIGMFLPVLPPAVIHWLCRLNYWVALLVTSFIPALPIMLAPLTDARFRAQTSKRIRRSLRRIPYVH